LLWTNQDINQQTTRQRGDNWEQFAEQFLAGNGLVFLEKNFHSRQGEIDLIMQDGDCLVFIEVKYRRNNNFGGAKAAIPYKKQQKIIKTAVFYLQQQGLKEYNTSCRFDVVAIEGAVNQPDITWLKNAFN